MSLLRGILLAAATALIAALGVGFFSFGQGVEQARAPDPAPDADAIVALTGGGLSRLTTAMDLLERGHGRRLLISGVNPRTPAPDVHALLEGPPELIACCLDLGRNAEDTLGNASETAAWAKRNGFSRLIVVTEDYHMPRSITELRIAMPEATLIAFPVRTRLIESGAWATDFSAAATLAGEYGKYLMIRAREAILGPDTTAKAAPNASAALAGPPA
jgi:uncharacterized SAM-binding protein YcdF (DUF218 family)